MASLWIRKSNTHKWHYAVDMRWVTGQPAAFLTDCGLQIGTRHPPLSFCRSIERQLNRPRKGVCKTCLKKIGNGGS